MSAVGKRRPVSTTTILPSYSTTIMFLPISPSPPSGRTRKVLTRPPKGRSSSCGGRLEKSVALEHPPNHRLLVLVELDVRQPGRADAESQHAQRGLHTARQRRDAEVAVDVGEALIDLAPALGLVHHPVHFFAE